MEEIYLAGGCLWGVQEFFKYVPGVLATEAGRANGTALNTKSDYDGYAECVRVEFDPTMTSTALLIEHLFEIIDPYSINKQGQDIGTKYRTGVYSKDIQHLKLARSYIESREDSAQIALEILPLMNFVPSDAIHQNHLSDFPDDHYLCHIPWALLRKYKTT